MSHLSHVLEALPEIREETGAGKTPDEWRRADDKDERRMLELRHLSAKRFHFCLPPGGVRKVRKPRS